MAVTTSLHLTGDGAAAEDVRRMMEVICGGTSGINAATDLAVSEKSGTPDMSVDVAAGTCWILGDESATQGAYFLDNQATLNVAISAADPTNARKDLIVAKVQDSDYSGATDAGSIVAVTGTPAGSPTEPTVPDNAIVLAMIDVAAAATSIVNANITDRRTTTSGQRQIQIGTAGAWSDWTPTWTSVTASVDEARYLRLGNLVIATCTMTCTSGGAGVTVQTDLPVSMAASADVAVGAGWVYSAGGGTYTTVSWYRDTSSQVRCVEDGGTGPFAITPAVVAGDQISYTVTYEAV